MFKLGDKVTSEALGTGSITRIDSYGFNPIKVVFDSGATAFYNETGMYTGVNNQFTSSERYCIKLLETPIYFTVGMTVYSYNGKGNVIEISKGSEYPVRVLFSNGDYKNYTSEGRYLTTDEYISLSQNPIVPIVNQPIEVEEFEIDEIVEVSNNNESWYLQYYKGIGKTRLHSYKTSGRKDAYFSDFVDYRYCRKIK